MELWIPSRELLEQLGQCSALAAFVAAGIRYGLRGVRKKFREEMMAMREQHLDEEESRIRQGLPNRISRIVELCLETSHIGEKLDHLHDCLHSAREEAKQSVADVREDLRQLSARVQSHGDGLGRVDDRLTALENRNK